MIAVVVAVNCLVWAAIWIPQTKSDWLRISATQAGLLSRTLARIPPQDEVVASQGVVGRFADRATVYDLAGGTTTNIIPVSGSTVWFVVTPNVGIETQPVNGSQGALATLATFLKADLVSKDEGIWVFRWHRPANVHRLVFPGAVGTIPAWVAPGVAGRDQLNGPCPRGASTRRERGATSSVATTGSASPVTTECSVRLSSATTTWIEVWDDNDNTLLAREAVPPTNRPDDVFFPLVVPPGPPGRSGYGGVPPFAVQRVPPVPGQALELRVWSPGGADARIYQLQLVSTHQQLSTSPAA